MINRAVIDEKKIKAIFKYIDTLNNAKQIKMMFRFNFLCGMRCINFCYLQIKDVLNEDNSVKDIIELTPDKNKGSKKAKYYVSDEMKKHIKEYLNDSTGWTKVIPGRPEEPDLACPLSSMEQPSIMRRSAWTATLEKAQKWSFSFN